jgi:hypothetical protein
MKGKSKIQLINPFTKKVEEEFENNNIITNAISNAFAVPTQYQNQWHTNTNIKEYCKNLTSLYTKGLGGILLWSEEIAEDAETVYPPFNTQNVGYAGSAYSGAKTMRGSFNVNESGILAGGWRNVWDFGTDKINDVTFKCLTLTHVNCGNNGWTSVLGGNSSDSQGFTQQSKQIVDYGDSSTFFITALDVNKILTAKYKSGTSWEISTFEIPKTSSIKITDVSIGEYLKSSFDITFSNSYASRRPLNFTVYDGIAHCINILSPTTFLHTEVNLSDYSITESIKTITGSPKTLSTGDNFSRLCVVYNGYYYICNSDYTISKHNFDGSFVSIVSGISLTSQYKVSLCDGILFYVLATSGATVSSEKVIEFNGNNVRYSGDIGQYIGNPISVLNSGIKYPISLGRYNSTGNNGLTLQGSNYYLGSINNLDVPITKPNGYFMKIIYEIKN